MNSKFAALIENLQSQFKQLMDMAPVRHGQFIGPVPKQGVYLFSEPGNCHLYVGRSRNIRRRYGGHCNPGATHNTAVFAFLLARETTGRVEASYRPGPDSREGLMKDSKFLNAFDKAKAQIRGMEFRFVEESDPTRQCLLEIYTAVALDTCYNNFKTH